MVTRMCQTCDMIRGLLMAGGASPALAASVEPLVASVEAQAVKVVKRKASAYSRRYKAAFAKIRTDYMTKSGKWKKNGFRNAVRAAHKLARR